MSLDILAKLEIVFRDLAATPLPDPQRPPPIYVSRMHFDDWAEQLRKVLQSLRTGNQWVSASDAKPPDMWTVIIYAISDIQPEGYISTGCYNHVTEQWHECIRVDPEQAVKGSMVFELFKDSVDDAHPNVLYWMDPRPPEGHTGNCND